MTAFTNIKQIGRKRVRIPAKLAADLRESLNEYAATPDMEAVKAMASDSGFVNRVIGTVRNTSGAGATATKKVVANEINLYKRGGKAIYNSARFRGSSPEEVQALISLATHAVLMAAVPGSTFAIAGGAIAKFAAKRAFSSVAWRAVNAVSKRIARNVRESLGDLELTEGLRSDWLYHASSGPVISQILQTGIKSGKESRRGTPNQQGVSFTRATRMIREFGGWAVAVRRSTLERLGNLRDVDFFNRQGDGSTLDEAEERYVGPAIPVSAIEAVITSSRPSRFMTRMFDFPFPLLDDKGNVLKGIDEGQGDDCSAVVLRQIANLERGQIPNKFFSGVSFSDLLFKLEDLGFDRDVSPTKKWRGKTVRQFHGKTRITGVALVKGHVMPVIGGQVKNRTSFGDEPLMAVVSLSCPGRDIDEGHGLVGTPEHNSWRGMKLRCNNKNHRYYDIYGGRGITVHKSWDDFPTFLKDMGKRPKGHTLDRTNVNKGYGPGNCVWSDIVTQNRNRRNVKGPFESMIDEVNGSLEFSSSASAEKFIHDNPPLRSAAAFSWWTGSGSRWAVAINRGGPSFVFVRQVGDQFVAGKDILEQLEC